MRDAGTALGFLAASLLGKLGGTTPKPSEHERLRLLETLKAIIGEMPAETLVSAPMTNSVGYSVLALLSCTPHGQPLSHRSLALDALLTLLVKCKDSPELLSSVMPAVCSSMAKIVSALSKEPHLLVISALLVLEVLLVNGFKESIPVQVEKNISALIQTLTRAAESTEDERILTVLRSLAECLLKHQSFLPLMHELLALAAVLELDVVLLEPAQEESASLLRKEAYGKASDLKNPIETRIRSLKLVSWLETLSQETPSSCSLDMLICMMDEQMARKESRLVQLIPSFHISSLLTQAPCSGESLPTVFGPQFKEILKSFDVIASRLDTRLLIDGLVQSKERFPEVALVLLGRTVKSIRTDPQLTIIGDSVIDHALQIWLDAESKPALLACSFMHCLVDISSVMKDHFDPYWRFILMDMLTWLSSPDPTVSSYAGSSLRLICGSHSESLMRPIDLVRDNLEYIVDQLGLQVRCPTVYPLAPRILTALLGLLGPSFASSVSDILDEVIDSLAIYKNHEGYVYELLGVISSCSASLLQTSPLLIEAKSSTCVEDGDGNEHHLSVEQKMAEKMSRIVVHFLLSDLRRIRLRSLQIMSELSRSFSSNRDAFLPLVHLMWPAVLGRVSESDVNVAVRALETIGDISLVSGDFMQARINQELWHVLKTRLEGPLSSSIVELRMAAYNCFKRLSAPVRLSQRTIQGLAMSLVDSLRTDSPSNLKEAAVHLGEALIRSSPDTMWFILVCQVSSVADAGPLKIGDFDLAPYRLNSAQISSSHLAHLTSLVCSSEQ